MNSRYQDSIVKALAAAIGLGGFIAISSLATSGEDEPPAQDLPREPLVVPGTPEDTKQAPARTRAPEQGDEWPRCDDARAAGTAPLHRGEPGYRASLDKDGDGIACEPYSQR